ncbi:MAG: GTP cyclohydrolase II, partial [Spirochaetes bacterium]|nr:GTP cyclohydrolase II [Spirochaetota bacterium]
EILKPDGTMARRADLEDFAAHHHLKLITVESLSAYRKSVSAADRGAAPGYASVTRDSEVNFPTAFGNFRLLTYIREGNGGQQPQHQEHHIALVKGHPETSTEPVLVRIHSECLTGDVFHSLRCDCGSQLHESLKRLEAARSGVLVYLRQEGRGIGLPSKMQAYMLQERGYDTVDANVALGFAPDERSYTAAADILKDLGVQQILLMTNNPEKIAGLQESGIIVTERVPLIISPNETNRDYLRAKVKRMGHLTEIEGYTGHGAFLC